MARGRQVIRQWKLLRALEGARRGLSVDDLVQITGGGCTSRTVYRDLHDLEAAGFPLVDEDGRWRVLGPTEGALSVPVKPTEVLALGLSEDLLSPLAGSELARPLFELRDKLLAMLTPTGRAWCRELRTSAVATIGGAGEYAAHSGTVDAAQDAIGRQHCLRLVYATPGRDPSARVVEPYCTWYAAGRLYLVAFCRKAEDIRTFAVERIRQAEVLDEPFNPDPSFDPAAFTRLGFGVYHGPVYRVVIEFSDRVAHLLRERRFHASQRVTDIQGGVRLTMEAAGLPEIAAWVAGFGGDARPVAPVELVGRVRRLHEEGLAWGAE